MGEALDTSSQPESAGERIENSDGTNNSKSVSASETEYIESDDEEQIVEKVDTTSDKSDSTASLKPLKDSIPKPIHEEKKKPRRKKEFKFGKRDKDTTDDTPTPKRKRKRRRKEKSE